MHGQAFNAQRKEPGPAPGAPYTARSLVRWMTAVDTPEEEIRSFAGVIRKACGSR
jgi:hypothetical protein